MSVPMTGDQFWNAIGQEFQRRVRAWEAETGKRITDELGNPEPEEPDTDNERNTDE